MASAIALLCYELRVALVEEAQEEGEGIWGVPWDYPLATAAEFDGFAAFRANAD